MADEVDPRLEAGAQIARALEIVLDAECTKRCLEIDPGNGHRPDCTSRDYTPDELETLFFALGTAMVQLAKLPGGKEARERFYHNAQDVLLKRGRNDIVEELKLEADRRAQAKAIVKKTYGDNVDFSPGTSGYALLKLVEFDLDRLADLRSKALALAATLGG